MYVKSGLIVHVLTEASLLGACYAIAIGSSILPFHCFHSFPFSSLIVCLPEEEVTNGTITVFVKYGVIPYFSASVNLCKALDLNCPVKAGPGTVTVKHAIRNFQPPVSQCACAICY